MDTACHLDFCLIKPFIAPGVTDLIEVLAAYPEGLTNLTRFKLCTGEVSPEQFEHLAMYSGHIFQNWPSLILVTVRASRLKTQETSLSKPKI